MKVFWIIYYIAFVVAGLAFFGAGVSEYLEGRAFMSRAERATAVVVANSLESCCAGKAVYCPQLEFTTSAGRRVVFEPPSDTCDYRPTYTVGQRVQVFYDPSEPTNAAMQDPSPSSLAGGIFLGGVFWFVPFITFVASRWEQNAKKKRAAEERF